VILNLAIVAPVAGIAALLFAAFLRSRVVKSDPGGPEMARVSGAIQEGAMAFLHRQYVTLVAFVAVVSVIIFLAGRLTPPEVLRPETAAAFVLGSVSSALAGYIGMRTATEANVRTTQAARSGPSQALKVAFSGGAVMGMLVFGRMSDPGSFGVVNGFAFGASSIALFARVGGGIYTKAADIGADIVGKIEAGIPEDDPRNPAVIADNVGDNVGDVAGMGADLFESYVGSIVAAIAIGVLMKDPQRAASAIVLPLLIAASGIIASIVGVAYVSLPGALSVPWSYRA